MKKYLIQTSPTRSFQQINPRKQQNISHSQSSIINTFVNLIRKLSSYPQNAIQTYVNLKASQFKAYYNLDFNTLIDSYQVKYVLFNVIELEQAKNPRLNQVQDKKKYENISPLSPRMENSIQRRKKTNIYIDLDFTQFLQKTQQQLDEKQKIIQKLQDVMIDKDNEIDILQDQNQELKKQIEEIFQQTNTHNMRIKNQKLDIEQKINQIQGENKILHQQIKQLNTQIKNYSLENQGQPEEFLRRCLLLQAISIEHFISSS